MNTLSKDSFDKVKHDMLNQARPLEVAIFNHVFIKKDEKAILKELKQFQNEDGGYGHALESDVRLPESSPVCTDRAMRILKEFDHLEEAQELIRSAIHYYESTYNKKRNGWYIVSKEVNNHPHAPWWHYNEDEEMTIIDYNWGNSSAEIISYLYKYRSYVKILDVNQLVEDAVEYFTNKDKFKSENEIYCFLYLYDVLPEPHRNKLYDPLVNAINQVIEKDKTNYKQYVPGPLDFLPFKVRPRFGISDIAVNDHLDFYIARLSNEGVVKPPWDPEGNKFYNDQMKPAYNEWKGVITLENLLILKNYNRITLNNEKSMLRHMA